ncbi:MAG: hypothetical protein OXH65_05860 [Paracoccaceae bacterium]|nr:hypothetical protein [Paracoccaceae bacterium]MDE2674618.1 hypothetical protein [Paracoccaceae bacterium]
MKIRLESNSFREWRKRDYLGYAPQQVKEKVLLKYGIPNGIWVETGTFMGVTTDFLAKRYPHVHSIEPSNYLFDKAVRRCDGRNVTLYNGVSEIEMPNLLPSLNGSVNFWLDGHYSEGITFRGEKDCPIENELMAIKDNLAKFESVTVFIDDVRCFYPEEHAAYSDYPSVDYLVNWARKHNFVWRIVHDIFIIYNSQQQE